jgi:hypothetical protein
VWCVLGHEAQRREHPGAKDLPLTPTVAASTVANLGSERRVRPNVFGEPVLPKSDRTVGRWFHTDAFVSPAPHAFGNAGIGIIRGPGYANFDFSAAKKSRSASSATCSSEPRSSTHSTMRPSVRQNLAREFSGFGQILSAGNARIVQLCVKFYFCRVLLR